MKKRLYIILVIFFYLFIIVKPTFADFILSSYFYSNNRSNVDFQVGFRIIGEYDRPPGEWRYSPTWEIWADHTANCLPGHVQCVSDVNNNVRERGTGASLPPDYVLQWGTGCIDPKIELSAVLIGSDVIYQSGAINVTFSRTNLNNIGNQPAIAYDYLDDIAWYEDNGGVDVPFASDFSFSCPRRPAFTCSRSSPGSCVPSSCNPATDGNCYNTNSCGGSNCRGPISGQVFLPGGAPLNGATIQRNGTNNQTTRNINGVNGSFRYTGLPIFSNHTIRLVPSSVNQCAYRMNDWSQSAQVIDNNVNFNLINRLWDVTATVFWDPDANGINNGRYARDSVRVNANPTDRSCSTGDNGRCVVSLPTVPGGRDYNLVLAPNTIQEGDMMFSTNTRAQNVRCREEEVNFSITKGYEISGAIFRDINYDGDRDNGEGVYTRSTTINIEELDPIPATRARARINESQTVNNGTYNFTNLFRGRYRVTLTNTSDYPFTGYRFTNPTTNPDKSWVVTVGPVGTPSVCNTSTSPDANCVAAGNTWTGSIRRLNFAITPVYSVTGGVFIDTNGNDVKDLGEEYWSATPQTFTIQEQPGGGAPDPDLLDPDQNTVTRSDGTFSFSYMLERTFRLFFNWNAEIYQFYDILPEPAGAFTPTNVPRFTLHFDRNPANNCVVPRVPDGITNPIDLNNPDCQRSSIVNLNFPLRRIAQQAFIHTLGGNVRIDGGFTNRMPSGRNFSGNTAGGNIQHGIVFSRDGVIIGNRGARYNPANWYVEDNGFRQGPDNQLPSGLIKSSYANLRQSIIDSGNGDKLLPTRTCVGSCELRSYMTGGENSTIIYDFAGDVTFANSDGPITLLPNRNYIFLVSRDLTINTDIIVPQNSGSTITFAAGRDIFIRPTVNNLQGIYSAGRNFKFDTQVTSTITGIEPDVPITVEGSIIVAGQFQQRVYGTSRTLTPRDTIVGTNGTPTITIRFRPDFVLNLPAIIRTALSKRIEVAPGN